MEYVQERITTLHDFGDARPEAPVERAAVVVPMTGRDHASLAAERVLDALSSVEPARVVVPLQADADRVAAVHDWLSGFDVRVETLWCDGPRVGALMDESGLAGDRGKGRDVWFGLGLGATEEYVVVHDADATTYSPAHVPRLLFPLARDFAFAKGYYARVENGRLYGRLCRLFFEPLVRALRANHEAAVLEYLGAFRYALAGEFAVTADLARSLRVQRGWGLEVGTLGDAFDAAGFEGTAQVDLGVHEHDHRSVGGPRGLSDMSEQVGAALLRVVEAAGVAPDYDALPDRYRSVAERLIDGYAADAAFNGLAYDRGDERAQVDAYAEAIASPGEDTRLPAWTDASLAPADLREAARADLREVTG